MGTLKERNDFAFYLTGVPNINLHQQLSNFSRAMRKYSPDGSNTPVESWFTAFAQLEELILKNKSPKKVIFLDELPWLDTAQSGFMPALDYFWNSFASARKDVILVVCGSSAYLHLTPGIGLVR